jgi:hypothetical protein
MMDREQENIELGERLAGYLNLALGDDRKYVICWVKREGREEDGAVIQCGLGNTEEATKMLKKAALLLERHPETWPDLTTREPVIINFDTRAR